jgi:hypothetical protein
VPAAEADVVVIPSPRLELAGVACSDLSGCHTAGLHNTIDAPFNTGAYSMAHLIGKQYCSN